MAPRKRGIAAPVKKPRLGARYMYISETESESEEINTAPPKKPGLKNKKEDVPPVAQTGKQDEEQQPAANASLVQRCVQGRWLSSGPPKLESHSCGLWRNKKIKKCQITVVP